MSIHTLCIDCAPGPTRPSHRFTALCKQTGLQEDWFDLTSKCFGEWTWKVKPEHNAAYEAVRGSVCSFLTDLYTTGRIRYAEW